MAKIVDKFNDYDLNLIYPTDEEKKNKISCAVNTNEFLFYSNNPESIDYEHLTENGKWLCRETVKGNGQIYT